MSKKYVPSFLKDLPPSLTDLSSSVLPVRPTNDFPDAFQMKKQKREPSDSREPREPREPRESRESRDTRESDLFPMNRKKTGDFDAFTKVKPLPDMDAFSMNKKSSTSGAGAGSADFDAFSRKPKRDEFPMNKDGHDFQRENERDPFRSKKYKENRSNTIAPVIPTASFAPGTLASLTARKATDVAVDASEESNSFAAKFAQRMKIMEDPDFVPPPAIVNVSSEEEFPTLGFAGNGASGVTKRSTTAWNLPSSTLFTPVVEDVVSVVTEEKQNASAEDDHVVSRKSKSKKIPVLRRKQVVASTEKNEEFKPIDYDEDAFEEEEWNQSDMDEEEFLHDSGDEEDDEDELNPNVYDDRRHRDDIY